MAQEKLVEERDKKDKGKDREELGGTVREGAKEGRMEGRWVDGWVDGLIFDWFTSVL